MQITIFVVLPTLTIFFQPREASNLKGKHLRIIATTALPGVYDFKRNSSGHVISTEGAISEILEWLSKLYDFKYTYNPAMSNDTQVIDDIPGRRGAISYLRSGEGDMIVAAIIPTLQRFANSDFTMPWTEGPLTILIPIPTTTVNIGALTQPMQKEIWICIVLSVPLVIAGLYGLNKCTNAINERKGLASTNAQLPSSYNWNPLTTFDYVIKILLSQGGYCQNKTLSFRLFAGMWCLCCFVLVQAYSSTLISFITLPNQKPIINSVYDIPKVPGLKVTVTRNQGAETYIWGTNSGIARVLQNHLLRYPDSRCNVTEDCIDKVRSGNHIYIHGQRIVRNIIMNDKKKTNKCHFTVARDYFWMSYLFFALAKESPYTEEINRGILRMKGTGLIDKWLKDYSNDNSKECDFTNNIKLRKSSKSQLTLNNMSSAFAILAIGYVAAIITFVFTKFVFILNS